MPRPLLPLRCLGLDPRTWAHSIVMLLALSTGAAAQDEWFTHTILRSPVPLSGCAIGELDLASPGNEVVAVGEDGRIYLCRENQGHWSTQQLPGGTGELVQCVIGDADPTTPGHELLVVGMLEGKQADGGPGVAQLVWREGKTWRIRTLFEDTALLHACVITDADPSVTGPEVYVAGFGNKLWRVSASGTGHELVAELPGAAKSMVSHDGGLAVGCADGSLLWVRRIGEEWQSRVIHRSAAGQARLASLGADLLVAQDDGELVLHRTGQAEDGAPAPVILYTEPEKLRGAALGDFDPTREGSEAATVGYGRRIVVLFEDPEGWIPRTVLDDEAPLHHLVAGEVDEASPGLELVACGHSGRLILAGVASGGRALATAPEGN